MFSSDTYSERATSIEDYQNTCSEFIIDISKDYKDWVDRYNLEIEEETNRKRTIDEIVKTTNELMLRFGNTIKTIDIIMNDGINKMAETTAGYPFQINVSVHNSNRYIIHEKKPIKLNIKSYPRQNRQVRITNYDKNCVFLLESSNKIELNYSENIFDSTDFLNEYILIKPSNFSNGEDALSITIKIEELENAVVMESRGYTTLVITK